MDSGFRKLFRVLFPLALVAVFPCIATAQQQVTPYGQSAIVMNAVTAPIVTPTGAAAITCHPPVGAGLVCEIQSLGQNVHYLTYTTASVGGLDLRLEGGFDGTNFFAISADATTPTGGALCAVGYYPYIRANLVTLNGGTVTAAYAGTSATSGCPLGTYNPAQNQTRLAFSGTAPATVSNVSVTTPYANAYGEFVFTNSAVPSNSTVSVEALDPLGNATIIYEGALATGGGTLMIPLPPIPASTVEVSYTRGTTGSSTGIFSYLIFSPPPEDSGSLGNHITTATSTLVKGEVGGVISGTLFSFSINQVGSSGALATIYDGTTVGGSCTGTVLGVLNVGSVIGSYWYNQQFYTGLCVTTTGGTPADITVNYR